MNDAYRHRRSRSHHSDRTSRPSAREPMMPAVRSASAHPAGRGHRRTAAVGPLRWEVYFVIGVILALALIFSAGGIIASIKARPALERTGAVGIQQAQAAMPDSPQGASPLDALLGRGSSDGRPASFAVDPGKTDWNYGDNGRKTVYLTIDDGPSENTQAVLDILDRYGCKATFFVVGTGRTAANQERMRQIVAAGHTLAMHSWSHDYKKVYASVEDFLEDAYQLYQYIHEVTGQYPRIFRFPGGSINGYNRGVYQEIIAEMTRRGFVYFDWNASAQDATLYPRSPSAIASDCLRGVGRDLVVVLAHDSAARGTTVDALPAIIQGYQNAGYTFAALHPGVTPVTMGYPKIH